MSKYTLAGTQVGLNDTLYLLSTKVKVVDIDLGDPVFPLKVSGVRANNPSDTCWVPVIALTLNPIPQEIIDAVNTPNYAYQWMYKLAGQEGFNITEGYHRTLDEAVQYIKGSIEIIEPVVASKREFPVSFSFNTLTTKVQAVTANPVPVYDTEPSVKSKPVTANFVSRQPYAVRSNKNTGLPANVNRQPDCKTYHAQVTRGGKRYYSGGHKTVDEAVAARDAILNTFATNSATKAKKVTTRKPKAASGKRVVVAGSQRLSSIKGGLPTSVYKAAGCAAYCVDFHRKGKRYYEGKIPTVEEAVAKRDHMQQNLHLYTPRGKH